MTREEIQFEFFDHRSPPLLGCTYIVLFREQSGEHTKTQVSVRQSQCSAVVLWRRCHGIEE